MLQNYFEKYGHRCDLHFNNPFSRYEVNKSRFRIWFMKNSTISSKYILLRSYPRSFAALRKEIHYQLDNYPNTIHPFSAITFYCEVIWMVAVFIWFIIIPFDVFNNLNVVLPWRRNPEYFEMFLAIIMIVDVNRRFFTGYLIRHCDSDEIVLDLRRISIHYLKTYFLIDLIPSLPSFIELIFLTNPNYYLALELFSFIRIFRLASMLRIFTNVMNFLKYNENVPEILNGFVILWFAVHWVSCCSILIGIVENRFDSSYTLQWYTDFLIPDLPLNHKYIICLHRTVSILSGTGYKFSSYNNTSVADLIYTILMAVLGHILTVVIFARAYEIVTGLRKSSEKYDEMLIEVTQYLNKNAWNKSTQNQIKTYYAYNYEHSFFNEHFILAAIPRQLQQTVLLANAKLLLDNIYFFKRLPAAIVANIVSHLAKEVLLAGDIVYKTGERGNTVYFLLHGTVAEFSESGREVSHIQDGSQFGEGIFLNDDAKHSFSVVAIETCEIFKLSAQNVFALIDYCPDLIEQMEKQVTERRDIAETIGERYHNLKRRSLLLNEIDDNVRP